MDVRITHRRRRVRVYTRRLTYPSREYYVAHRGEEGGGGEDTRFRSSRCDTILISAGRSASKILAKGLNQRSECLWFLLLVSYLEVALPNLALISLLVLISPPRAPFPPYQSTVLLGASCVSADPDEVWNLGFAEIDRAEGGRKGTMVPT